MIEVLDEWGVAANEMEDWFLDRGGATGSDRWGVVKVLLDEFADVGAAVAAVCGCGFGFYLFP